MKMTMMVVSLGSVSRAWLMCVIAVPMACCSAVFGDVDTAWDEDFIWCFVWIVDDCPEPALTVALNADP